MYSLIWWSCKFPNGIQTCNECTSEFNGRWKLASAPPSCKSVYSAHPTKREGVHKSIYRNIRTRTGTNNESSCVRPEDGSQQPPQALARTARVSKSHVSKRDIAMSYADAAWRIRTFISNIRAIPQELESTQKLPNSSLSIHAIWGTLV